MSPPFYTLTCHTKLVKFITFNEPMSPTAALWLLFIFIRGVDLTYCGSVRSENYSFVAKGPYHVRSLEFLIWHLVGGGVAF
jgi:hypothetical protein